MGRSLKACFLFHPAHSGTVTCTQIYIYITLVIFFRKPACSTLSPYGPISLLMALQPCGLLNGDSVHGWIGKGPPARTHKAQRQWRTWWGTAPRIHNFINMLFTVIWQDNRKRHVRTTTTRTKNSVMGNTATCYRPLFPRNWHAEQTNERRTAQLQRKKTGFPDTACLWLSVSAEWPPLIHRRITDLLNTRRRPLDNILNVSNLPQLLRSGPSGSFFSSASLPSEHLMPNP